MKKIHEQTNDTPSESYVRPYRVDLNPKKRSRAGDIDPSRRPIGAGAVNRNVGGVPRTMGRFG
jgi:hypothetical protein